MYYACLLFFLALTKAVGQSVGYEEEVFYERYPYKWWLRVGSGLNYVRYQQSRGDFALESDMKRTVDLGMGVQNLFEIWGKPVHLGYTYTQDVNPYLSTRVLHQRILQSTDRQLHFSLRRVYVDFYWIDYKGFKDVAGSFYDAMRIKSYGVEAYYVFNPKMNLLAAHNQIQRQHVNGFSFYLGGNVFWHQLSHLPILEQVQHHSYTYLGASLGLAWSFFPIRKIPELMFLSLRA